MVDIDYSQLNTGTVITYKLRPGEMLNYPEDREWHGKIIKTVIGIRNSIDLVWIESLDEDFKGLTKYVLLEQITRIEGMK